jgi:hypothetical protein
MTYLQAIAQIHSHRQGEVERRADKKEPELSSTWMGDRGREERSGAEEIGAAGRQQQKDAEATLTGWGAVRRAALLLLARRGNTPESLAQGKWRGYMRREEWGLDGKRPGPGAGAPSDTITQRRPGNSKRA